LKGRNRKKHQTTENVLKPTQSKGENSGTITLNGPAARKVQKNDIIIISYATMEFEAAKTFKPWVIFPNENDNSLT
jgi:aspartate 1-decarboxylase